MTKPAVLVIAGEKSGEEHFMGLYQDWVKCDPTVKFFGVGGDEMSKLGVEILYHLRDFSSWGFSEVIGRIPFYLKAMRRILNEVESRGTRFALLIDFQTFNLKIAEKLQSRGVQVFYYVAPQAWAWKEYRVKRLARAATHLFAFLPFEKKWFSDRGVKQVIHVAHPLYERHRREWPQFQDRLPPQKGGDLQVLLLPGSRKAEVKNLLPIFLNVIGELQKLFKVHVLVVTSPSVEPRWYHDLEGVPHEQIPAEKLSLAMLRSDVALAASGTVTLSMALFGLPGIVAYKGSLLEQFIYENAVSYRGAISLANLFLDERVYPELIQDKVNVHEILFHLKSILLVEGAWGKMRAALLRSQVLIKGELPDPGRLMAQKMLEEFDLK